MDVRIRTLDFSTAKYKEVDFFFEKRSNLGG